MSERALGEGGKDAAAGESLNANQLNYCSIDSISRVDERCRGPLNMNVFMYHIFFARLVAELAEQPVSLAAPRNSVDKD